MKYLITGVSGFVGKYIVKNILSNYHDAEIVGLDINPISKEFDGYKGKVLFKSINLLNFEEVKSVVASIKPDFIIHLAAYSSVAYSWESPVESFKNNSNIFLNVLEAVRLEAPQCRLLSIGSSEQYGNVSKDRLPLCESYVSAPVSPYAVARVAQEEMAKVFCDGYGVDIVMTRSFNHSGPGQDERFVLSSFAKRLAMISRGLCEPKIEVGNLNIIRDFLDVRDVVKAYISLLKSGRSGEVYNVCSGVGRTLRDCLSSLVEIGGIECEIVESQEKLRPTDIEVVIGDNSKIKSECKWAPNIPFEDMLGDLYKDWLIKV